MNIPSILRLSQQMSSGLTTIQIDRKWDNAVQDVEDVPEDVAGWTGRKVGDVERFDDNVDNAYDQGRDDRRYDDDGYDQGRRYDDDDNY